MLHVQVACTHVVSTCEGSGVSTLNPWKSVAVWAQLCAQACQGHRVDGNGFQMGPPARTNKGCF